MTKPQAPIVFDKKMAATYDEKRAKLAPLKDALHLCMRLVLADLPEDARVLCVGVGTGDELLYLAQAFPAWHFTAVEPASSMLDICRAKAKEKGFADRCTFHEGYLNTLPQQKPFDAATAILVSHFLKQPEERSNFFREIGDTLKPHGYLINADIASNMAENTHEELIDVWFYMLKYSGMHQGDMGKFMTSFSENVGLLAPQGVEKLIIDAGFDSPVLFFQNILKHAWFSRKSAKTESQ